MKIIDITGQRFERLIAIEKVGSNDRSSLWKCKCDCGNEKIVTLSHLRNGNVRSCGCLYEESKKIRGEKSHIGDRTRKHGDFGKKLYNIWGGMKRRCYNENTLHYNDYGGRGIEVCNEWMEYKNFKEWAINNGYKEGLSIERINVNDNYKPSNCKWIPKKDQAKNRRNTIKINYNGNMYSFKELSSILGLSERTLRGRWERGWTDNEIADKAKHKNQY